MRTALSLTLLACSISFVSLGFAQSSSLHGIDLSDLDRKAAPCDDFYEFANGTWRANNPIPASMTRWSRRWQSGETAKEKLHDILEAAAADKTAPKGSTTQLIGDCWCLHGRIPRQRPRHGSHQAVVRQDRRGP